MHEVLLSIGTALLFGFAASGAPVELSAGRAAGEVPVVLAAGSSGSIYVAGVAKNPGASQRLYVARIDAASNKRESTAYLGGSASDAVKAIAVDRAGNAYIVGHTSSPDFPVFGVEPTKPAGGTDVFLAKIDAKGNWLYSTLLGGAGNDGAHAVAVDAAGDVYVTGWTASTDFPADGPKSGAVAAFLVRFRAGAKLSATLIGQGERTIGNAIAVDRDGAIYIAGTAEHQTRSDAFLWKLTNSADLVYRSTISSNGDHAATSLALAPDGSAWIAGWTNASDSPLRHSGDPGGARDAFAARFDAEGIRTFSKVAGGASDDEAHDISVDALGNLYLAGITSSPDFPAPRAEASAASHSFAIKWSPDGDRLFLSEPVAPVQARSLVRMAVDHLGNAILTTNSGDGGTLHLLTTCHYRLSKAAHSLEAGGGDGAVLVDAPAECPWTAQSNSSWIAATRAGDRMEFRALPNHTGVPRVGAIEAGGQYLTLVQPSKGGSIRQAFTGAIRNNAGFKTTPVTACDDCSASIAPIGFSINFFGTTYTQIYVNNNGNVTFGSSNSTFTPDPISAIRRVLIAPFWADVDTRGTGSSRTTYGQDVVNGRTAFGVNWVDVGYYSSKTNKLNSMQLVLIDRGDLGIGYFDIELNYSGIQWETGDASGGNNGLGGNSARAGFSNGTGTAGTYFELPGSGVNGALLDGGANSLSANSTNSGVAGRYVYNVRAGSIVCGTGITTTTASLPIGGGSVSVNVTSSNAACTWNVAGLPSWITVTTPAGGNGTGTATVTMQVAANTGAPRSATIIIAGQSYTVSQAGSQAPTTCPPYSFLRGADVSMMSGNLSQGSLAGLERLLDGSLTLHNFTGNTTNFTQSSTPQYQQAFANCIGRPPTTPTPPQNYALLSEKRGISATNPIITNLTGAGTSSSVGVAPYSKDAAKLQVYNATTNRTPGTNATYDIPANPQKLLSGDLNADTRQDIVLISQGVTGGTQGVLSSFPGNANGTLGTRRDVNVGNNPQSATLFDFNGDTRLDAAVANTGSNNVMILNGNGDASFQSPVTLTGDAPGSRAIAAADLNKDSRGDLIIGHNDGVDIRLGNGNGSFQAPVRVARGFTATSVASGDFNKDGNPDIAVSAQSSATAMILLGNGNGTFGPPNSYVTRANAGQFFVSDFDWDGNPDLVFGAGHPDAIVAASNDSSVTVLYGRGNGTLHSSPAAVLPSLGEFTAGDFNNDNLPDVAATAPFVNGQVTTAGLYLFLNNGTGALVPQSPIPIPTQSPAQLFLIASDDFNGDGRRDIAVTTGSTVRVATGTGFGGFNAPVTFTAGSQLTSIQAADVNGDSRPDLLFTDDGEDRVSVALGNGNGTFQGRSLMTVGVDPKGVAAADVNGDGRIDLIVVNLGQAGNDAVPGGISVLLGSGNGAFQQPSNFPSGLHPTHVTVGDVNLDGRPDIITSTGGANATTFVAIHLGNGNGTFQNPTLLPVALGPAQIALTDFNADGKADLLVGHCCGDIQLGLLLGNGNGTFQTEAGIPNTGNGSSYIRALDMNRDTKPDIVYGANGTSGAYVALLLNTNTVTAPVCSFGVSQTSYQAGTQAQTLTGTITSSASTCSFNAQSSASWLSITPTFGQGQSITTFTIAVQNNAGAQRSGTVTIGGQAITVTQSATACPFNLSPLTLSPPPAGGSYNITVTNNSGCPWSITGVPHWVTILSPANLSSAGTGAISLSVAVNPGAARIANLVIAGQNFAITQAGAGPAGGLRFTALEPCRLLETRAEYNFENRSGVFGPPFFNAGDTRSLPIPSSTVCRNIPANAKAYVLNVTVVPNGALDFVTVFPTGETRPNFWTVRSPDGLIVANSAIVAAGTGGAISVYASNRTDIIIDISGYFTDNPVTSNLVYYPLTPCRVIETRIDYRSPPGPFGPPTMASRETRPFRFPNNGVCPVPTGAAAYAATITVVPPGPLAFLTAWPEGQNMPNVSSMNSPGGRVLANSVIVPASPDGGINLFTFDRSDVIVDITGYFGPDDGVNGLFYFPVRQCRVSQTNGTGFTGVFNGPIFENETTRTIPIPASTCTGIPATAKAYSLNATVMPGGSPMPFLTISPSGQPRPNASVINAFEGQTVSSGFLVSAGTNGAVDIFAYRRTHVALEISGYFGR